MRDMKKVPLFALIVFSSFWSFAQTPPGSFVCKMQTRQELSAEQINAALVKQDLEPYRLYDKRTTLKFDNGFDVELLSAKELEALHMIPDAATYHEVFLPGFRMPVFHMAGSGFVTAAYTIFDKKYSDIK